MRCIPPMLATCTALSAIGCGSDSESSASSPACEHCIECAPEDSWEVLAASSAGNPDLRSLGDAEPVSPEEVGDGKHHLFVGVANEGTNPGSSCGNPDGQPFLVLLHDATSDRIDGDYTISATPIVSDVIVYDRFGMETPTYLRTGDREYLYYCALYQSYDCSPKGKLMALRRTAGGSWERVTHDVAPFGAGSTSQCEPELVHDPHTGKYHLFFIADGELQGTLVRTSSDPELFPPGAAGNERVISPVVARPGVARDPHDGVWRLSFNGYDADDAIHSWTSSLDTLEPAEILEHSGILHASRHALHPEIHLDAPAAISQSTSPVFPSADEIVFFYSGVGTSGQLRVNAQRCMRR